MNKPVYLISAATGVTGGYAIESLLAAGQSIRVLVHREDERSDALKAKGVELFVGDFADVRAVRKAMHGVTGAYFCYPIAPGIVQATAQFAQAARESEVDIIVNMSQVIARADAGSNASLQHWLSERVFDWSGVPVVHLRPTFFAEWLLYMAQMIAQGTIYASYDQGKTAFIAAEDQGRVIAEILQRPSPHLGKTYPLYGSTEYTFAELAEEVGRVLGRPIGYQQVPFDTMRAAFLPSGPGIARNDSYSGYAESTTTDNNGETFVVQHLREASEDHNNGLFSGTNRYVEQITGQSPMTIEAFVNKHRAYFGQEAAGK
jgi:uncharacterized protein YbjT (DUF2867 family)